jgi:formylglycine-generating enzyme required for sulfatase activity
MPKITIPQGFFDWRISKEGYEDVRFAGRTPAERLQAPFAPSISLQEIPLDPKGSVPPGMVKVPGGNLRMNVNEFGVIGPFSLKDYFIDRYEVTNREFKQFVDRGLPVQGLLERAFPKGGDRALTGRRPHEQFRDLHGPARPGNIGSRATEGTRTSP